MPISPSLRKTLLDVTGALEIVDVELIQGVWGGYGSLFRVYLQGGDTQSVVVKLVNKPKTNAHPKGWNTPLSHQRKMFSYQVELNWYRFYGNAKQPHIYNEDFFNEYYFNERFIDKQFFNQNCYLPHCLFAQNQQQQIILILEDLANTGYPVMKTEVSLAQAKTCLSWLASFHAIHMDNAAKGLWPTGTYWHLATRPDELEALQDIPLKNAALKIDHILKQCPFQTIVHGDAKLANFCFSEDGKQVAAVDFQYVGLGCGMKDVILFISSSIPPEKCEQLQPSLLDFYFEKLTEQIIATRPDIDAHQLELSWRPLYSIAWADFQRFVKGWSPDHWKINPYTEQLKQQALDSLTT